MPAVRVRSDIDCNTFASECAPVSAEVFVDALLKAGFSPEAYRDAYGDLREHGMDATSALRHYIRFGLYERRPVPLSLNWRALADLARLPLRDADFRAQLLTSLLGHTLEGVSHPFGPVITELWPIVSNLAGARPYFIAGDSHSGHFAMTGWRTGDWLLAMHLICHGGSARGLANPASRSGYGEHLRRVVQSIGGLPGVDRAPFLLQFGQVDIEFVYHFHRVRDGRRSLDLGEYRAFCAATIERYLAFVTSLFAPPNRSTVFLVSIFPPALSDDAWRRGHLNHDIVRRETDMSHEQLSAGIRQLEIADLRQRTAIHAHYNDLLRAGCRRHGFGFVDSFTPFLGRDGVVDPNYAIAEAGGLNHHLDSRRTYAVLSNVIWEVMRVVGTPRHG